MINKLIDRRVSVQIHNRLEISGRILKLLSYPVFLTYSETDILVTLMNNIGKYLSAEELSKTCGKNTCTARSVVTHIYSINQKAAPIISRQLILSKRGEGYILNSKI